MLYTYTHSTPRRARGECQSLRCRHPPQSQDHLGVQYIAQLAGHFGLCMCPCWCTCVRKPEVNVRLWLSSSSTLVFEIGFLAGLELANLLGILAQEPQGFSCLRFSRTGITNLLCSLGFSHGCWGIRAQHPTFVWEDLNAEPSPYP